MEQLCGPNYREKEVWSIRRSRKQRKIERAERKNKIKMERWK